MCAPSRSQPQAAPAQISPVPTPVSDTQAPQLDLAVERNGQADAIKQSKKRIGAKSLRTDMVVSGNSSLNIPQ